VSSAAYSTGIDHLLSNPPEHSNLLPDTVAYFSRIYCDDDIYNHLNFSLIHRIVLGLSSADLETQLLLCAKDVDARDTNGRTPIWWAARRGDAAKLEILLNWGADCKLADYELVTPLHKAVADGGDICVEILLAAGAVPDAEDDLGAQPIHGIFFSPTHRPRTIQLLVLHGVDVNASTANGSRPLNWATSGSSDNAHGAVNVKNAKTLIEYGADFELPDHDGFTPVMEALWFGDLDLFMFLVGIGARLDRVTKRFGNILHIAARVCNLEWIRLLGELAIQGKMVSVDAYGGHQGHDALDCMRKCRDRYFAGTRMNRQVELEAFTKLMEAVEESSIAVSSTESEDQEDHGPTTLVTDKADGAEESKNNMTHIGLVKD
jgi:ankyrin repeat protein